MQSKVLWSPTTDTNIKREELTEIDDHDCCVSADGVNHSFSFKDLEKSSITKFHSSESLFTRDVKIQSVLKKIRNRISASQPKPNKMNAMLNRNTAYKFQNQNTTDLNIQSFSKARMQNNKNFINKQNWNDKVFQEDQKFSYAQSKQQDCPKE